LQWTSISGLENYGHNDLAREIAKRWIQLNTDVSNERAKLMEKYNVVDTYLEAGVGNIQARMFWMDQWSITCTDSEIRLPGLICFISRGV